MKFLKAHKHRIMGHVHRQHLDDVLPRPLGQGDHLMRATRQEIDDRIKRQALAKPDGYVEYELRTAIQDAIAVYGAEGVRLLADDMIGEFISRRKQ